MAGIVFDAGDSTKWNLLWDTQVNSASAPNNRYYPIADIEVPFLLSSQVIAVFASSETARPHWKSAGFINQKIRTGILVGGNNDARYNGSQRLLLGQINVLEIPVIAIEPEYSIRISIHPWHEDIYLQLWEFTGDVLDSTENLLIEGIVRRIIENRDTLTEIKGIVERIETNS